WYVQMIFYTCIVVVGVTGNFLVCHAIFSQARRKTNDMFILNLAVTDLGTCAISIPFDMAEQISKHFLFGKLMCSLLYPLQTILMGTSVLTLLAVSIERYKAIVTPLQPKLRGKLAKAMLIGSWVLSVAVVAPYMVVLKYVNRQCIESWPVPAHAKTFTFVLFVVLYAVPMVIITYCYVRVLRRIHRDRPVSLLVASSLMSNIAIKRRARQNLRLVKMFVTAVVAFALCLLPNHVVWLWNDFGDGHEKPYFGIVLIFSNTLIYTNSIVNPFIF
ncbi:predicted protein, partial [Nematostella vectensis]